MERGWRVIDGGSCFRIQRLAPARDTTGSELLSLSPDAMDQVDELRLEVASLAQKNRRTIGAGAQSPLGGMDSN